MVTAMSNDEPVLGQMIGLRALLRRYGASGRLWLVTGLVGLVLGACLHLATPSKYTAVTNLYLTAPAGVDPTQAMVNDVSLLQTEVVAQEAVTAGRLHMTPDRVALPLHRSRR